MDIKSLQQGTRIVCTQMSCVIFHEFFWFSRNSSSGWIGMDLDAIHRERATVQIRLVLHAERQHGHMVVSGGPRRLGLLLPARSQVRLFGRSHLSVVSWGRVLHRLLGLADHTLSVVSSWRTVGASDHIYHQWRNQEFLKGGVTQLNIRRKKTKNL